MTAYRLYTVVPRLLDLINNLTNWYIRFNRSRLKATAGGGDEDSLMALNTLFQVLFILVRALAPFIPFLTNEIYSHLSQYLPIEIKNQIKDHRSVHFLTFPEVREELFNPDIVRSVGRMRRIIELARVAREKRSIGLKVPLHTLVVIADTPYLEDLRMLERYIYVELNIRHLELTSDETQYNVKLKVTIADWSSLGKRLKKDAGKVRNALLNLREEQIRDFVRVGSISVDGINLTDEDLTIVRGIGKEVDGQKSSQKWEINSDGEALILLDTERRADLEHEGIARDIVSRVQRLRKTAGLVPTDDVQMEYQVLKCAKDSQIRDIMQGQREFIEKALGRELLEQQHEQVKEAAAQPKMPVAGEIIAEEEQVIMESTILLRLVKI